MTATALSPQDSRAPHIFLLVGEESGDQLGASVMRSLRAKLGTNLRYSGVGGRAMAAEGLTSLFPLTDVTLFGFVQIAAGLPRVARRLYQTVDAIVSADPDILVIIDSPDFTQRVARRVRARAPHIPIVNYVSPSVWAWRPGRARAMRGYVDRIMALLPFEPEVHLRLGGPPCTFVGHPLAENVSVLRPSVEEAARRAAAPPTLLVLPGSRRTEIRRMMGPFGEVVARISREIGPLDVVVPTLPHVADEVRRRGGGWPMQPRIVTSTDEKYAAFRIARAALAASGTVTLELALSGVPMVAAYRMAAVEAAILRRLIRVPSVVLANLVLGENVVPEFLQENCTSEKLTAALSPLLSDTPERRRQCEAFARLDSIMEIGSARPSDRAADVVIASMRS